MSTSSTSAAIVELRDVHKIYKLGKLEVPALKGIDLSIAPGEFAVIAGPSGSGKTTLLNLIGCVDVATRGMVRIDGHDTRTLSESKLTRLRLDRLGFIFQSFNLVGVLDAFDNVEFPLLLQGKFTKAERRKRVEAILDSVGLSNHMHHRPNELSGGQRQRVAIARALVTRPRIVLADEPTANLDSTTGHQIIDVMKRLNHDEGTTFIFSTHDHNVMNQADRSIALIDGRITDSGTTDAAPTDPTPAAAATA